MSFIDTSVNLRQTESTLEPNTISTDNAIELSTEAEQISNNESIFEEPETTEANPKREEISRRRRRVSNNDPAEKIINYLKTRKMKNPSTNAEENLVKVACDRIDMEFLGYANTVKTFSLHKQAIVKLQITNIITQAQLEELNNIRPNSNSSNTPSSISTDIYYIDQHSNMSNPMQSEKQPSYYTEITQIHSPDTQTHAPSTQIHSIPTVENADSQNCSTIAQIHIPNTQTHLVPTFINTNSQNLSTITQIHSPNTQKHSPNTQTHSPNTQIHSSNTQPIQTFHPFHK